jgi:hypothetical protein
MDAAAGSWGGHPTPLLGWLRRCVEGERAVKGQVFLLAGNAWSLLDYRTASEAWPTGLG